MAENANTSKIIGSADINLARERLLWVTRPLGLLVLVLWVLHPDTSDRVDYAHSALLGFLFGAFYGLLLYGGQFRQYLKLQLPQGRLQTNRVPEEYYWGKVENVMFDNS